MVVYVGPSGLDVFLVDVLPHALFCVLDGFLPRHHKLAYHAGALLRHLVIIVVD